MDCTKKYTVNDFKVWASRQAGFDFQRAPTWEKTTYDAGQYAISNKIYYESLIDENHDEISVAESWKPVTPEWKEPEGQRYDKGTVVLYEDNEYYQSQIDNNVYQPTSDTWLKLDNKSLEELFPEAKEWSAPKFYNTGDRVLAMDMKTFKFSLYESQEDNNYDDPTTATDEEESEDADISDVVLDSEIEEAMAEARFKFNPALFANEVECKKAFSLLTAFFVAYDKQMSDSGINGGYKGLTSGKKIGDMSVSYILDPAVSKGSQAASFFYANPYGKKYYNLIQPRLKAMSVALGRSTNI